MAKKVMHVVESFASGVFSFLVDLVNGTCQEYDIVIVYGKRKETVQGFEKYFNGNVKFIELQEFKRNINVTNDFRALIKLKKIIKDEKPDIIHLHSSKAGFIGRFANTDRNVKLLYNPHGFSFLMQNTSKVKRLMYWLLEKIASYRKCTIVGCSNGEYQEALKLSKNSICINNAINLKEIDDIKSRLQVMDVANEKIKFCTIGRIGYQKNPQLFNDIAEKFIEDEFIWIGDGELRDCLKSKNIKVTGWQKREETLKILNNQNVFLLTSLWEGCPISLLEAMAFNKVCVVTNVVGNRDVIKNGFNGFVANNIDDFVKIIMDIKQKKVNTDSIIDNSRLTLEKEFNTEIMIKKYREKYG